MLNDISASDRQKLISLLGDLPHYTKEDIKSEIVFVEKHDSYIIEKLVLYLNGIEPVPAYFLKPGNSSGKLPVILYNHAHGGDYQRGKEELLKGASYLAAPCYADSLIKEGYAILCIDAWAFGERRGRTETQIFKNMLWNGQILWGMMLFDGMRALDYLETRGDCDMDRVGTIGISMGGTMSWWITALDTRIKVCVDMCGLADYHTLVELNGLDGHGVYYYVPGLLKHFTTAQINKLIAPRPHLSMNGLYDALTPAAGFGKIYPELKQAYIDTGAGDKWLMKNYSTGHYETSEMRKEAIGFFKKWL